MAQNRGTNVLIESDWNLKQGYFVDVPRRGSGINRIRLEFKVYIKISFSYAAFVLIESDWNLKRVGGKVITRQGFRINRIRLEFKVAIVLLTTCC